MNVPTHARALLTAALLMASAAQPCNAGSDTEGAAPPAYASAAVGAPEAVKPPPGPSTAGKAPTYAELMKMNPQARREVIDKMPSDEQSKFLFSVSDMQRAVLLFDPADCSSAARIKRRMFATGEKADGIGEGLLKSGAGAVARGILGFFVPGGKQIIQAAEVNEVRIGIQKQAAYVDVCDLPEEERNALLNPVAGPSAPHEDAEPAKPSRGFLDEAGKVLTK